MTLFDGKPLTEAEIAARECPHGCLWIDHDEKGWCMRECDRCPQTKPCERPECGGKCR